MQSQNETKGGSRSSIVLPVCLEWPEKGGGLEFISAYIRKLKRRALAAYLAVLPLWAYYAASANCLSPTEIMNSIADARIFSKN